MPDYSFVDSVALERIQYRRMRLGSGAPRQRVIRRSRLRLPLLLPRFRSRRASWPFRWMLAPLGFHSSLRCRRTSRRIPKLWAPPSGSSPQL